MNADQNKAVSRRFYEIFGKGNMSQIGEIVAAGAIIHTVGPVPGNQPPRGPEGTLAIMQQYREAFPDIQFTIEDQVAEGDLVTTRWTSRGTNRGPLMGMPATGKSSSITGIDTNRIRNGKIEESWVNFDALSMLVQLGVVPAPGQGK